MSFVLRLLACAGLVACGSNGASATFAGTVHGVTMQPKDAISAKATVAFSSGAAPVAAIVISDLGGLCITVSANLEPKSSRALFLFLADVNSSTGAIEPAAATGVFPVFVVGSGTPPAHFSVASFGANDALCKEITAQAADAVSGSVTLTANGGGAYDGTYDLTFDSGDHVTGAFHTGACDGLTSYLGTASHGCGG